MLRIARFAFAMVALLGAAATLAQATAYPNKPVKIIVTFTTGGAADFTARVIGDQLSRIWNQQVVVENRIGAGGSIGVEQVFRSPPDGYTLLLASNTHAINQAMFPNLSFDLVKDFVPVMLTTSTPIVLAVNPRVKANDMKEFTALLRANPGKIDYSTCGVATAHHFAMELYKYATKTYAVHIPHRGCSPAVTDAVAGQVDVVIASLAAVLPFAKQGKLRILGLTTRDRSPSVPDIATFRESGLKELANYEVENYYGVLAPAGTPRDVLAKIEADIRKVLAMPEVKSRLTNGGLDLFVGSSAQFTALLTGDIAKFREAIKVAGIKPE